MVHNTTTTCPFLGSQCHICTEYDIYNSYSSVRWNCNDCKSDDFTKCNCRHIDTFGNYLAECVVDHAGKNNSTLAYLCDNQEVPMDVHFDEQTGTGVLTKNTSHLKKGTGVIPVPRAFLYDMMYRNGLADFFDSKFKLIEDDEYLWNFKFCKRKIVPHMCERSDAQKISLDGVLMFFQLDKTPIKTNCKKVS